MASQTSADLIANIAELEQLRQLATRPNVQAKMDELQRDFRAELAELRRRELIQSKKPAAQQSDGSAAPLSAVNAVRPMKKLTQYAFDESDKFVKLYYTVPGISAASDDCFTATFTEDSFDVQCRNVAGIDYQITAQGFCHAIDAAKCLAKRKSGDDLLLVMLKKTKEGEQWDSLLKLEKKQKEKAPKLDMDDSSDPQDGLMKMMKQMYDEGDDDMKRTIRKSWHEAQSQGGGGGPGGMGMGMGGMMGMGMDG